MRAATRQAAELAGVRVLGLVSEPTAAAIAFGYDRRPAEAQGIVVDLGGGTFDVTVLELDHELLLVIHLMIAGRLRWREPGQKPGVSGRIILAALEFEHGTLLFTEAGSKKRASLQLVRGKAGLQAIDPGGLEPLDASLEQLREALSRENHTPTRARTNPRVPSGIGNAYSDEILHAARLSPLKLSRSLSGEEWRRIGPDQKKKSLPLSLGVNRRSRAEKRGFHRVAGQSLQARSGGLSGERIARGQIYADQHRLLGGQRLQETRQIILIGQRFG